MLPAEHAKLMAEFDKWRVGRMIEVLNNYKGSSGKKYKSDYLAIRSWVVDRVMGEKEPVEMWIDPVTGKDMNREQYDAFMAQLALESSDKRARGLIK